MTRQLFVRVCFSRIWAASPRDHKNKQWTRTGSCIATPPCNYEAPFTAHALSASVNRSEARDNARVSPSRNGAAARHSCTALVPETGVYRTAGGKFHPSWLKRCLVNSPDRMSRGSRWYISSCVWDSHLFLILPLLEGSVSQHARGDLRSDPCKVSEWVRSHSMQFCHVFLLMSRLLKT